MAEAVLQPAKMPWHGWVVGAVSLPWNAVGAMDFVMTESHNATYLKGFTPAQLAYFFGFPLWVVLAWGVATWGSVLGSVLLLARRALAMHLFAVSLVAMLLTMLHNYVLTDGLRVMGGSAGALIFSGVILLVGVLLLLYSRVLRGSRVLR